jgi:ribosomal protein S15P/S13E
MTTEREVSRSTGKERRGTAMKELETVDEHTLLSLALMELIERTVGERNYLLRNPKDQTSTRRLETLQAQAKEIESRIAEIEREAKQA